MPEKPQNLPEIDKERCISCGACAAICAVGAITGDEGKPEITSPQKCTYCAECEETCPVGAISVPFTIGWSQG
jgi:NADH-quinone oxidoreductase subunit F/NADP-reducing hydrogenase subunit HndC